MLLLGIAWSGSMTAPAVADDLMARYLELKREFQSSTALSDKEERKEALQRSLAKLEEMLKEDTERKVSDRCHYLLGQGRHHLYEITRNRQDLKSAIDQYRLVVKKYPSSPLADDAQYLIGMLHLHDNPTQAYQEFSKVGLFFPKGDKKQKAEEMALKLEKQLGCGPKKKESEATAHDAFAAAVSSVPASGAVGTDAGASSSPTSGERRVNLAPKNAPGNDPKVCFSVNQLVKVNHVSGEEYTRVVLYTNEPVKFDREITKADPQTGTAAKIEVLLKECVLNPQLKVESPKNDPFLKAVRAAQQEGNVSRVSLDVDSIDAYRIFSLADPYRVIVDVRGKRSEQTVSADMKAVQDADPEREGKDSGKDQLEPSISERPAPSKSSAMPSLAMQLGLDVKRIAIDPGHGGKDKGASGPNKVYEKDVVLAVAKRLKKVLEERTNCEVILTRTRDKFMSLEERTGIANAKKADLFISIHTNAHEDTSLHGVETYFLNLSKDKNTARVAAMENAMSSKKISDLETILHDLMTHTKINESKQLARQVHKNVVKNLKVDYENVKDLGTKQAPFYVLLGAEMPSILIESAFITNQMEEKRLQDKDYQEKLAQAIASGVEAYIQQMRTYARAGD